MSTSNFFGYHLPQKHGQQSTPKSKARGDASGAFEKSAKEAEMMGMSETILTKLTATSAIRSAKDIAQKMN
jgi:hypothetical protein